MKITGQSKTETVAANSAFGTQPPTLSVPFTAEPANMMAAWPEYMVDALQRSVLFLDLLRQRGNEEIEITSRPLATVLSFGHRVLMDGRSLPRPMNYTLSRIMPPPGIVIDPRKRPVVVVDPRAGQGPGIGGFKAESEIGDALECRPSRLFHRLRCDARAGPAVPGRRRGTGEDSSSGWSSSIRTRLARSPSATARPAIRR